MCERCRREFNSMYSNTPVYYEKNKGWLFSGDMYVADKIKYFATYESMLTQIESLKKLIDNESIRQSL